MLAHYQYNLKHCFSNDLFSFDYLEDGDIKLLRNPTTKLLINNFTRIRCLGLSPSPLLPYVMLPIIPATHSLSATRERESNVFLKVVQQIIYQQIIDQQILSYRLVTAIA